MKCADTGVALDPAAVVKGRLRESTEIAEHSTLDYGLPSECKGGRQNGEDALGGPLEPQERRGQE